jgi:kinetochore protein NNF1
MIRPHTLPPASLLSAHLAPYLAEQSAAITETLQTTQAENTRLADSISSQRGEIEALLRGLEGVVKDLEDASGTLDAAGEMKGVRGELEGVAGVVVGGR